MSERLERIEKDGIFDLKFDDFDYILQKAEKADRFKEILEDEMGFKKAMWDQGYASSDGYYALQSLKKEIEKRG